MPASYVLLAVAFIVAVVMVMWAASLGAGGEH